MELTGKLALVTGRPAHRRRDGPAAAAAGAEVVVSGRDANAARRRALDPGTAARRGSARLTDLDSLAAWPSRRATWTSCQHAALFPGRRRWRRTRSFDTGSRQYPAPYS